MVACFQLFGHTIPFSTFRHPMKLPAPKAFEHKPRASLSTCPNSSPGTLEAEAQTTSTTLAA